MIGKLKRLAAMSPHPAHKHATLILRGGAVVSFGYNHDNLHSELVALSRLWPNKRRGTSIINIRITRGGAYGLSFPCPSCLAELKENGVIKVSFTNKDGRWSTCRI